MFFPVNRFHRPLAFLLIAAQLLLATPAFAASVVASAASAATQANSPCHGMTDRASADDPGSPSCCSGEAGSMQTCLASCTLGAVMVMNISLPASSAARINAQPALAAFVATASTPPLKPPPIV